MGIEQTDNEILDTLLEDEPTEAIYYEVGDSELELLRSLAPEEGLHCYVIYNSGADALEFSQIGVATLDTDDPFSHFAGDDETRNILLSASGVIVANLGSRDDQPPQIVMMRAENPDPDDPSSVIMCTLPSDEESQQVMVQAHLGSSNVITMIEYGPEGDKRYRFVDIYTEITPDPAGQQLVINYLPRDRDDGALQLPQARINANEALTDRELGMFLNYHTIPKVEIMEPDHMVILSIATLGEIRFLPEIQTRLIADTHTVYDTHNPNDAFSRRFHAMMIGKNRPESVNDKEDCHYIVIDETTGRITGLSIDISKLEEEEDGITIIGFLNVYTATGYSTNKITNFKITGNTAGIITKPESFYQNVYFGGYMQENAEELGFELGPETPYK